jgi:hypothetical protein
VPGEAIAKTIVQEELFNLKGLENRLTEANTWNRIVNRKVKHPLLIPVLSKQTRTGSPGIRGKGGMEPRFALRE